jgi:hypothetical protein
MSLAMYAAPFDDDNNNASNKEENTIAKKRTSNNRTQKRVPSEKVNSVLDSIHSYNEDTEQLSDFKPISPPVSAGVEQTKMRENMANQSDPIIPPSYRKSTYNMPYYQTPEPPQQQQVYQHPQHQESYGENSVLIDKLNYMIKLLEEQQDERTNNVTEEVVLYCFLGIFIIFIVDSFVRVGKYVR